MISASFLESRNVDDDFSKDAIVLVDRNYSELFQYLVLFSVRKAAGMEKREAVRSLAIIL